VARSLVGQTFNGALSTTRKTHQDKKKYTNGYKAHDKFAVKKTRYESEEQQCEGGGKIRIFFPYERKPGKSVGENTIVLGYCGK